MADTRDTLPQTDTEWQDQLSPEQYEVLRREGTERAGSSPLNAEKRQGTYHCAGCGQPLFSSDTKYESGTGWPSFYQPLSGALDTTTDFKLIVPGIRPSWAASGDQKRITTPAQARDDGADVLVIGRPITGADDPAAAAARITDELAG